MKAEVAVRQQDFCVPGAEAVLLAHNYSLNQQEWFRLFLQFSDSLHQKTLPLWMTSLQNILQREQHKNTATVLGQKKDPVRLEPLKRWLEEGKHMWCFPQTFSQPEPICAVLGTPGNRCGFCVLSNVQQEFLSLICPALPCSIFYRTHLTPAKLCILSIWIWNSLGTAHPFVSDCSLFSTLIHD